MAFVLWILSNGLSYGFYQMVCPMDFINGFCPMDFIKWFVLWILLMVCPMDFVNGFYSKGLQRKISVGFVSPSTGLLYRTYTPDFQ
jgi:hypothetical protein